MNSGDSVPARPSAWREPMALKEGRPPWPMSLSVWFIAACSNHLRSKSKPWLPCRQSICFVLLQGDGSGAFHALASRFPIFHRTQCFCLSLRVLLTPSRPLSLAPKSGVRISTWNLNEDWATARPFWNRWKMKIQDSSSAPAIAEWNWWAAGTNQSVLPTPLCRENRPTDRR